jgi:alpha/beta superfamily hydrolase
LPEQGFSFGGWLGDVAVSQQSNNPVEITMDTSKNVVARFVRGATASASDLWLLY